jgi:DNA repair photolyase
MQDDVAAVPLPDPRRRQAPQKGRGTMTQLAHRFAPAARERTDVADDLPDNDLPDFGDAEMPAHPTLVTLEHARSILSRNDSPDIPFTWALNPYRGCEHGCIYCYARPTHSYLNLSPGLDFETRLVAKVNAAALLRRELVRPGHESSPINIGSATDAYQPIEREWRITRNVLEVLGACEHAYTLVTKSGIVLRDIDLLAQAARRRQVYVMVSITTLDEALSRTLEPRASAPQRRLQTVRRLVQAGVPVGVNVAPIIPFLNEPEIEQIIDAAAQAGAQAIHYTVLRLPWEVKPLFEEWLGHHVPLRAARIMARLRELRGGKDYDADFRLRMKGEGVWAQLIAQRVRKAAARHGLGHAGPALDMSRFDPARLHVEDGPQMGLF